MKIAIIGAGISGLSQYLFLCKLNLAELHDIKIYEARSASGFSDSEQGNLETYNASVIGASIGLSPTGLKVLKRLHADIHDEVLKTGHIIRSWRLSTAWGWKLANIPAGGRDEMMVMIGREVFWRILKARVPELGIIRKKVVDIRLATGSDLPALMFADQSFEEVDLIISADGIWSIGRRTIFGGTRREKYAYSPHYEYGYPEDELQPFGVNDGLTTLIRGLIGVGGFVPSSILDMVPDGEMNIVNGANGFFGYGYCTDSASNSDQDGKIVTWWSTYSLKDCPNDWRKIDREDVKKQLQLRHKGWKNKIIQKIVENVEIDSVYPMFTTPLLPTWEKGNCVLIGDAAHALQPSSGQGASMALEDCETLALLLRHHLETDDRTDLSNALRLFSDIRRPRLQMVHKKAQELAGQKEDMGIIQEMLMYFFIWLFSSFKLNESYQRRLNEYEVPNEVENVMASFKDRKPMSPSPTHL